MKTNLLLSITIFLLALQEISGQNYFDYYKAINKAEIAHLDKNFQKSDSIYQLAFKLVDKPYKDDCLLAALNSENLNDNHKVYEYLKKGISVGLTIKSIKKQHFKFKKSDEWKSLKKNYTSIRQKYLETLDLKLRKELIEMVSQDQAIRHPIFGNSKKQKTVDNNHYNRLLEIIKENNGEWPGRFTIGDGNEGGKYAFGEVTIMLHHFSKKQVNNLKPILIDAIKRGDLSPYNVAYPLDYKNNKIIGEREIKRGKVILLDICLPIGSYISTSGNRTVICDCEKTEEERKKLGLEPLADYFRKRDTTYECYEDKEIISNQ